jgi:hypothetical protein
MLPDVAKRLVLHIGAMKSGTSFIQDVLLTNRERLREHGISFAGDRWRDQVLAVKDLIGHGSDEQPPFDPDGPWQRLVREIDAWPGTAIVSMEFLAPRARRKIVLIQQAFPDTDLQVVLTARDLGRNIPAMWIESVQNRGVKTWPEFLDVVRRQEMSEKAARWFWGHQRVAPICHRWSEAVGRDHFTLITVPPKGSAPDVLWDRFASVAGIPAGTCELSGRSNPGLDLPSAMLLRDLNERLAKHGLPQGLYDRRVKRLLAKTGLAARRRSDLALGLDERWVRKLSRKDVKAVERLGVRIVGDLDDLRAGPVAGLHSTDVRPEQLLEAALDGLEFMVTKPPSRGEPVVDDEEVLL